MDYQQTIDYLYNTLPMFSRMGSAAFRKDLHNIKLLCEHLGNPHLKFKSVHVGGTNGKGSVSHMLAAIYQSAGYKTGLYTSPHLYDFRERIRLNGEMADKQFVIEFVEENKQYIELVQPSFFEITVAMAFDYFSKQKVDIAIIEVGLGGRLDSTNIITPELSIITNIGWDHMNMLGNSLEEIAFEKAGIIKPGVPVIIGERQAEIDPVFTRVAEEQQSAIYFAQDEYEAVAHHWHKQLLEIDVMMKEENKTINFKTDLPGIYQLKNICTVLQAELLMTTVGFPVREDHLTNALKNVKKLTGLQGRWDVIHNDPTVVLEVAHNKNGIEEMLKHIAELQFNNLHLIIGMVKDKDVEQVLQILPPDANYYFTQADIPRALDAQSLEEKASAFSLQGNIYPEVNSTVQAALANATKDDLIIVCGSIFLVAEVNRNLEAHQA